MNMKGGPARSRPNSTNWRPLWQNLKRRKPASRLARSAILSSNARRTAMGNRDGGPSLPGGRLDRRIRFENQTDESLLQIRPAFPHRSYDEESGNPQFA